MTKPAGFQAVNVGSGRCVDMETLDAAGAVTGRSILVVLGPAVQEPHTLVADVSRARELLDWEPQLSTLRRMVADAWNSPAGEPWQAKLDSLIGSLPPESFE